MIVIRVNEKMKVNFRLTGTNSSFFRLNVRQPSHTMSSDTQLDGIYTLIYAFMHVVCVNITALF